MCFSSKSPAPPTNTPAYAPEDAYKHFTFSQKKAEPQAKTNTAPTPSTTTSVPQVKPKQEQIRM